ncbi:hypothetical protein TCE0_044r16183 [Talaromyces pinophilus]|uniref:Uncharacterized protein n=1 Tax=Talaromyces pinophilus TaxID=128442 RepID=A0A478EAR1_TALPI|nr:hypothetical protein TCE0_044r16183 [Talaromyces pinophilus]
MFILLHVSHDFGEAERSKDFITTVAADSALLQLPDHVEDKVPLHADHSMMVKFDTQNAAGYRTALDKLRRFTKDAPAVVVARFTQARYRPRPCSTVPFKQDPMFVGREDVLGAVTDKKAAVGQRHERVALVGLVARTKTASQYSHCVRESVPDMWVFWIHASNVARWVESYQRIAGVAKIPRRDDPKTNVLQLVYQWLCDESNGRWLMVLDNADDDQIFFRSDDADGRARYELKRIQLLQNEDSVDAQRDPSIRSAVIMTWQLSFEEIQPSRPAATDLLSLMSMYDRQGSLKTWCGTTTKTSYIFTMHWRR